MTNPLLEALAGRLLFDADLYHDWTDGEYSECRLCGEAEIASGAEMGSVCEVRVKQLMIKFAEEANRRKLLEFV